jgi:uncharacterized protein YjbJ (UPF0337 family)
MRASKSIARTKELAMSNTIDKVKGTANQAAAEFKQGVGKVVGSRKPQTEGQIQNVKDRS